jgi:hypothetical protein
MDESHGARTRRYNRGGAPSRASCPLLFARWSADVRVKLRQPPTNAIRRMRNPRMQRSKRDEVAGTHRRRPPLPPVHAPDAGASQTLITDALPLPAPSPTTSTTTTMTVPAEGSSVRQRHDTRPASIAELCRGPPLHTADLDRLPIEPRGFL